MDLAGVGGIITALTGLLSVVLTAYIILRVGQVHKLTNSNFSSMQATLAKVLEDNAKQAAQAQQNAHDTAMKAAQTAVEAAKALAAPQVAPPPPAVQILAPVVETITAEHITTGTLQVTDQQMTDFTTEVTKAVETKQEG